MSEQIKNKVAASGLVNVDLSDFAPQQAPVGFDMKDVLWQEMVLKEKDFRSFVKQNDWSAYQDQNVAIYCSVDAIIPDWAFMLIASALSPFAKRVFMGTPSEMNAELYRANIEAIDKEQYRDARLVVKGCGDIKVPTSAFVNVVSHLQPVARSIMYGEPCSTVPVFKRPKK